MEYKELRLSALLSLDLPGLAGKEMQESYSALMRHSRETVARAAESHRGKLAKSVGDSFILTFQNAQDALDCAVEIRDTLVDQLPRIGLHTGEVYFFDNDIFGEAVNIASAVHSIAAPGSISGSAGFHSLLGPKQRSAFVPVGDSRQAVLPEGITAFDYTGAERTEAPKASTLRQQEMPSLEEIRKEIFEFIRASGRRPSVDEALERFSNYGPEGSQVIASLAESGFLLPRKGQERTTQDRSLGSSPHTGDDLTADLGKSIEKAIHSIVSEIEQAVSSSTQAAVARKGSSERGFTIKIDKDDFRESTENLRLVGRQIKRHVHEGTRHARRSSRRGSGDPADTDPTLIERYRTDISAKAKKARHGVAGSIISFLVINPVLWYINFNIAPGFPWAPLVSIFWGSGVIGSILAAIRTTRHEREAAALPDLSEPDLKELKAIHKERDSIASHFMSTLSIPVALYLINMATNAKDPWFMIPTAILGLTFAIHFLKHIFTFPSRTKRFFAKFGIGNGGKSLAEAAKEQSSTTVDLGKYSDLYRDAASAVRSIEASLAASSTTSPKDLKSQMDSYLGQVRLLAQTANELDGIISEIPQEALAKDKATLIAKRDNAQPEMRMEYERSIAEIAKQEESFSSLKEQREVLDLRLKSSISQIQQLKVDLARARAADADSGAADPSAAISSLRERSRELSSYLDDLRQGQQEAAADPFAELEAKYGKTSGAGSDTPPTLPDQRA